MAMPVDSLLNACRLCLKVSPDNVPILRFNSRKPTLSQKIWKYFSIWIEVEDLYPQDICPQCLGEIENFCTFSAEVEKVQKKLRTMVSPHSSLGGSKMDVSDNKIEDLGKGFIEPEKDPLDTSASEAQLQIDQKPQLVVTGANIAAVDVQNKNTTLQTQCQNQKQILTITSNAHTQNKPSVNVKNFNQTPPFLLISGVQNNANSQLQSSNQTPPLFLISGVQNNTNSQTQLQNTSRIVAPVLVSNSGVPNRVTLKIPTHLLNSNKTIPYLIVSGNSLVQSKGTANKPTQPHILPKPFFVTNNSNVQNQVKSSTVQTQFQNTNQAAQLVVVGAQNKVNNLQTQPQNPSQMVQLRIVNGSVSVQSKEKPENALKQVPRENQNEAAAESSKSDVQDKKASSENMRLSAGDGSSETAHMEAEQQDDNSGTDSEATDDAHENLDMFTDDDEFYEYTQKDADLSAFYDFTCAFCKPEKKTFKKYVFLDRHCQWEHDKKAVIECCGKELFGEFPLLQHMKKHTQCIKCPVCDKQLAHPNSLKLHMMRHLPEEKMPYRCGKCGKGFSVRMRLQNHENTHLSEKEKFVHVCQLCGKKNSCFECLAESALWEQCDWWWQQHDCNNQDWFSSALGKRSHERYFHQKVQNAMCHICPKTFPTYSCLRQHLHSHNTFERECVKCAKCGKLLKNKATLRVHMKTHEIKKTSPCPYCKKDVYKLRSHLKCHQEQYRYECVVCKKRFKRSCGFKAHMVVHTGEKPFQCPNCPRTFASKSNYHTHILRMHTGLLQPGDDADIVRMGKKQYRCPLCPQTFSNKSNCLMHKLRKHMKRKNGADGDTNDAADENHHSPADGDTKDAAGGDTNDKADKNQHSLAGDDDTNDAIDEDQLSVADGDTNDAAADSEHFLASDDTSDGLHDDTNHVSDETRNVATGEKGHENESWMDIEIKNEVIDFDVTEQGDFNHFS